MNDPLFRQSFCLKLKKQIRGSKDHLIVGIDVAKNKHNAFSGRATGKTLFKRLVFENAIEGFKRLLIQTDAVKKNRGTLGWPMGQA